MSYEFRHANPEDALKLSILYKQVYIHTYGLKGVSNEFANFITEQFSPKRLISLIQSEEHELWVATFEDNLIGTLRVDYAKTNPISKVPAPEINKLYVLSHFFGKSIGQTLIQHAQEGIKARKASSVWLWLLESNQRALDFYNKQGFSEIGKANFEMEENTYKNTVMLKQL